MQSFSLSVGHSEKELADLCVKLEKKLVTGDQLDSAPYRDEGITQVKHPSADFLVAYATPAGTMKCLTILLDLS